MRLLRRLEKRLVSSAIFEHIDLALSRRSRPEDAVVVAGYWRSGTTFLLELVAGMLQGRSYFEPLHFLVPQARPFHAPYRFEARGRVMTEAYPYLRAQSESSPLDAFLREMLAGRISTPWTRKARSLGSVLKPPVVVKLVRGNLLLAYLERKFACHSLLLVRHPGAVVASLRRGQANLGIYSSENFLQILLDQKDLLSDHLLPYEDHIRRWNTSPLHRLALTWAITHFVPLEQMKQGLHRPHLVIYENLALGAERTLAEVLEYLGRGSASPKRARTTMADSLTSKRAREKLSAEERCFSWKNELAPEEIDAIHSICGGFGPTLLGVIAAIDALRVLKPPAG